MYLPGEALNQDTLLEPWDVDGIYIVSDLAGVIARNATKRHLSPDMPPVNEDLADALFRLSENYGIDFPGIGCIAIKENIDESFIGHTYTTAQIVDGFNMHDEMTRVPVEVTVSTIDKILAYYEDMSRDFSSQLYLADLSLRQCIYGRVYGKDGSDNGRPSVNFVDYDRRLSNISKIVFSKPFANWGEGFGGIAGLDDDLYALKTNYPDQNFNGIAQRLLGIADHQGIFYKVPTAYDQVKALSA